MDIFNIKWKRNFAVNTKHLLLKYSKDNRPYTDYNLEFVNCYHHVKWMNQDKSLIDI